MAKIKELEHAINRVLDHQLGMRNYRKNRLVSGKLYEAYVFGLCLRAICELNAMPRFRGISGHPNPFIFRGAPGKIGSKSKNYGYVEFEMNDHEFELHAGVEFRGTSGMTHELDVCIMRAPDAQMCRELNDDPAPASLVGGWECKFYGGNLHKSLGRAFVGLVADLGSNFRLSGLCSNSSHLQLRDYFQAQRRPFPHFELTPLDSSNEHIFVNKIKGELKKMTAS